MTSEPRDSGGKDADGSTAMASQYNFYGLPGIWSQCQGWDEDLLERVGGKIGKWKGWVHAKRAGNRQEMEVAAR